MKQIAFLRLAEELIQQMKLSIQAYVPLLMNVLLGLLEHAGQTELHKVLSNIVPHNLFKYLKRFI